MSSNNINVASFLSTTSVNKKSAKNITNFCSSNITTEPIIHSTFISTMSNTTSSLIIQNSVINGCKSHLTYQTIPSSASCNLMNNANIISNIDPINQIKTLTNSVSSKDNFLEVSKAQEIRHVNSVFAANLKPKPPPDKARQVVPTNAILHTNNINSSHVGTEKFIPQTFVTKKAPTTNRDGCRVVSGSAISLVSPHNTGKLKRDAVFTSAKTLPTLSNEAIFDTVFVPRGWNRILEKGSITYSSPNKSRIRCMEDLLTYLISNLTCKCGLQCPFKPEETFNFNPNIPSKFTTDLPDHKFNCIVKSKFNELFPPAVKIRLDVRGRRIGAKTKRSESTDEITYPDRKKMLLTGASPLELFQSGMNAINSLSSAPFKNTTTSNANLQSKDSGYFPSKIMSTSSQSVIINNALTEQNIVRSHSLPEGSVMTLNTSKLALSMSSSSLLTAHNAELSLTSSSTVNVNDVLSTAQPCDMPFPKSLMGEKRKRTKFLKPKTQRVIKSVEEITLPKRQKKINVTALTRATDAHLLEYLQQNQPVLAKQQLLTQAVNNSDVISDLKKNQSSSFILSDHRNVYNTPLLTSTDKKTTGELKEPYKHLQAAVLNQQIQNAAVYVNAGVFPGQSELSMSDMFLSNHQTKLPPNRTVSSNDLSEALHRSQSNISSARRVSTSPNNSLASVSAYDCEVLSNVPSSAAINTISSQSTKNSYNFLSQPVNKPLKDLNISSTLNNSTTSQARTVTVPQQMVLVQLVSQGDPQNKGGTVRVNSPIVRAFPMSHQQTYVHTNGQNNYIVMGKGNSLQTLHTIGAQITLPNGHNITTTNTDSVQGALQIRGVAPDQMSQGSSSVSVQYMPAGYQSTFPLHYIPSVKSTQVAYVYTTSLQSSSAAIQVHPVTSNNSSNFVRIAPAVQPSKVSVNAFEQVKKKKELQLLSSIQEQLRKNSSISIISPEIVSKASSFLNSVALETSKISALEQSKDSSTIGSSPMSIADYMKAVGVPSFPVTCGRSGIISLPTITTSSSTPNSTQRCINSDVNGDILLHCDEKSSDLLASGDSDCPKTIRNVVEGCQPGDIVWTMVAEYPSWPGKIISAMEAKMPSSGANKVYVRWFGSSQVHAVNTSQCEPFTGMGFNVTSKGYRNSKQTLNDLDKAILEALEELERKSTPTKESYIRDVKIA